MQKSAYYYYYYYYHHDDHDHELSKSFSLNISSKNAYVAWTHYEKKLQRGYQQRTKSC